MVAHVSRRAAALWYALDLFQMLDLETSISPEITLHEERNQYSPLRMGVNAATGSSLFESSHEEWCALRWLQRLRIDFSRMNSCPASIAQGKHLLRTAGFRKYSLVLKSMTNMCDASNRSFCTPEGAM